MNNVAEAEDGVFDGDGSDRKESIVSGKGVGAGLRVECDSIDALFLSSSTERRDNFVNL